MQRSIKQLFAIVALAVVAGLSGAVLLGGLLTGALDGPARGADVILRSEHPVGFWLLALFYLVLAVGTAVAAHRVATRRPAA
jgi:hypothetical protein